MTPPADSFCIVHSPAAMEALGRRLGERLCQLAVAPSAAGGGCVLGLEGDLGAGKTTFVRGLVAGVTGLERLVASPTFQLLNLYRPGDAGPAVTPGASSPPPHRRTLAHIDAYRLTGAQAFWELGIADLLEENMIVAVEWPSRTRHAIFDTEALLLQFDHIDEHTRRVTLARRPATFADLRL